MSFSRMSQSSSTITQPAVSCKSLTNNKQDFQKFEFLKNILEFFKQYPAIHSPNLDTELNTIQEHY